MVLEKNFLTIFVQNLNISKNKRVNSLTEEEVLKIREFIDENYKVEGDLRREISLNIKRLNRSSYL